MARGKGKKGGAASQEGSSAQTSEHSAQQSSQQSHPPPQQQQVAERPQQQGQEKPKQSKNEKLGSIGGAGHGDKQPAEYYMQQHPGKQMQKGKQQGKDVQQQSHQQQTRQPQQQQSPRRQQHVQPQQSQYPQQQFPPKQQYPQQQYPQQYPQQQIYRQQQQQYGQQEQYKQQQQYGQRQRQAQHQQYQQGQQKSQYPEQQYHNQPPHKQHYQQQQRQQPPQRPPQQEQKHQTSKPAWKKNLSMGTGDTSVGSNLDQEQRNQSQQALERGQGDSKSQGVPDTEKPASSPSSKSSSSKPSPSKTPSKASSSAPSPKDSSASVSPIGDFKLVKAVPGREGRPIMVESNHIELNLSAIPPSAVHYDVDINPDTPKYALRNVMLEFKRLHYPKCNPAFDGRKNLYSVKLLPFGDAIQDTVKVAMDSGDKEYKVTIKFAAHVDLTPLKNLLSSSVSPQEAIQCLDVVLRNSPSNRCIIAGRSFFTKPTRGILDLGEGMEMYNGFYQSAIRCWKPLLNIDVAHKAFPKNIRCKDLILELLSSFRYTMTDRDLAQGLNPGQIDTLRKYITNLKILFEIPNQRGTQRVYRVNGLGKSPIEEKFTLDNGQKTTVAEYFFKEKRYNIQYPKLPTVWVGNKARAQQILLPIELCTIMEGQTTNRKMTENQTASMIKYAATSAQIRKGKIMDAINTVKYNQDPCVREFGISVKEQFEQLQARVLNPPTLEYANDKFVRVSKGVWRSDNEKFYGCSTINKWTIACADRSLPNNIDQLAEMIYSMGEKVGIRLGSRVQKPFDIIRGRQSVDDVVAFLRTKKDMDLVFVIVPSSGPQYASVKKAAELVVGCLTQCIKSRTVMRFNAQIVGNILLKVNSKMNGKNHCLRDRLPIMTRPCIIMGADVTHPAPDSKDIPSVAAVTASHDPKAFQYNVITCLQPPRVEIIEDLTNIVKKQLLTFYRHCHLKPEKIIFFRDGVSEGQFDEVRRVEVRAIRAACTSLENDYKPALTFLVVQKRHHTRLFPMNPRDSEDKNGNVPAGTCVDHTITHPFMQDFYLVSHASIQGVAKPTKYCTIWDDNDFSNDDIEKLTYYLCHMYTRCNRSVSYPAPTYYAHLAAARAKVYTENERLNMSKLKELQMKYSTMAEFSSAKPMFFV